MFYSSLVYRLNPEVQLEENRTTNSLNLIRGSRSVSFSYDNRQTIQVLRQLERGLSRDQRIALEKQPDFELSIFEYLVLRLVSAKVLEFVLTGPHGDHLIVYPSTVDLALANKIPSTSDVLSRFAFLRRVDRKLFLFSPEANCAVSLESPVAIAAVGALAGINQASLQEGFEQYKEIHTCLVQLGFVEPTEANSSRESWEFHDLLFHADSRPGLTGVSYGGSYRFRDQFPSPNAERSRYAVSKIDLHRPSHSEINTRSSSLFDTFETRRSWRRMGAPPISFDQLSELLYRVARVVKIIPSPLQELVKKVIPAGGAIHEIEFYVSVGRCTGLAPAFYHYHSVDHALYQLSTGRSSSDAIIARAAEDWVGIDCPQVVITLASRHPRIAWKYDTGAYRATMLNAGVIVQSLYLVSADMGLACTPAGRGCPHLFALATGLDRFEETSILEIGIGARSRSEVPLIDSSEES